MKMETDCCKIIRDTDNIITNWVCQNLHIKNDWIKDSITLGVMRNNQIIAGLIYHDIEVGKMLSWTIYTQDKHWCTRNIIKEFMRIAFDVFSVYRINIVVDTDNDKCLKFVQRLGFTKEGCLREFGDQRQNRYILGLLKAENKYK